MGNIAWYDMAMESREAFQRGRSVASRGISFALVAALSFFIGLSMGTSGSAGTIVTHVPFVGDGLDATPDTNADSTAFWKAWNTLSTNYVITHASSTLPSDKERLYGAISGLAASYGDPIPSFSHLRRQKRSRKRSSGSFGVLVWKLI